MSESKKLTEDKKKPAFGVIGVIFLILVAILAIGIYNAQNSGNNNNTNNADKNIKITKNIDNNSQSKDEIVSSDDDVGENNTALDSINNNNDFNNSDFDLASASKPRILGNPNAPIKISEHSSFTCGHCSNFHKTNFKKIRTDYIDTGKAYIVFNDFPLNAHDVKIGVIARCVPEKSYFQFIQLLFETQKDWLKEGYINHIKQNAQLTGVSSSKIDECLNSEELFEALADQRQNAMDKHGVNATPTLVINDHLVIPGLASYDDIKKALDAEYEKNSK